MKKISFFQIVYSLIENNLEQLTGVDKQVLIRLLGGQNNHLTPSGGYPITIDHDQPIALLIQNCHFSNTDLDIFCGYNLWPNKNGIENVKIFVIRFDKVLNAHEVSDELDRLGLRPANLKEILAFSLINPDIQRNNLIVGLGSTLLNSKNVICVPYLSGNVAQRKLSLTPWDHNWQTHWQFAAVEL